MQKELRGTGLLATIDAMKSEKSVKLAASAYI